MRSIRPTRSSCIALFAVVALSACGIKGGLYLPPPARAPEQSKAPLAVPAAITPAANPAPASQSAPRATSSQP